MDSEQKFLLCGFALIIVFFTSMVIADIFKPKVKTCYVTEWRWEKANNGVRVRVPVKQVCVEGESK